MVKFGKFGIGESCQKLVKCGKKQTKLAEKC